MVNQIEIEGYTKTGFRVVVRDNANGHEAAKKLIDSVSMMGLLPARPEKPDEHQYGRISHVALTHTDDGTPHVAFFHENVKMESRFTHKYLNTQAQRDEFEAWSGLKLAGMLAMEGNAHPQRGKAAQAKFLHALPQVMALIRVTEYKREVENGQEVWKPENDVERYIGVAKVNPLPSSLSAAIPPSPSPSSAARSDSTPPQGIGEGENKGDVPEEMVFWWQSQAELARIDAWLNVAKSAKPEFIEAALKVIAPMKDFDTAEAYIAALKQIASNEEDKAKGDTIPFS